MEVQLLTEPLPFATSFASLRLIQKQQETASISQQSCVWDAGQSQRSPLKTTQGSDATASVRIHLTCTRFPSSFGTFGSNGGKAASLYLQPSAVLLGRWR